MSKAHKVNKSIIMYFMLRQYQTGIFFLKQCYYCANTGLFHEIFRPPPPNTIRFKLKNVTSCFRDTFVIFDKDGDGTIDTKVR